MNQNNDCRKHEDVCKDITDYDVCIILPTGWSRTIQTIRLTGKQIQDLHKEGYDAVGTGNNYPYVLVSPENGNWKMIRLIRWRFQESVKNWHQKQK